MSKCEICGRGNHNNRIACWNCGSDKLIKKKKTFDRDSLYKKIVEKYLKDGKTLDEANNIAQKVTQQQELHWQQKVKMLSNNLNTSNNIDSKHNQTFM